MCYTNPVTRNLTLTLDDDLLRSARKVALDRDTSVNQMVRDFLADAVCQTDQRRAARRRIAKIFRTCQVKLGPRTWTREDLHER